MSYFSATSWKITRTVPKKLIYSKLRGCASSIVFAIEIGLAIRKKIVFTQAYTYPSTFRGSLRFMTSRIKIAERDVRGRVRLKIFLFNELINCTSYFFSLIFIYIHNINSITFSITYFIFTIYYKIILMR